MSDRLSGRLVLAARALAGISRPVLARASGLESEELRLLEAGGSAFVPEPSCERLLAALDQYGVLIVPEGGGMGAGVRLKFTRQDAKQIARLEGEGGMIGSDDVP
jgi:hypothetical protein